MMTRFLRIFPFAVLICAAVSGIAPSPARAQVETNFWNGGAVRVGPSVTACDAAIRGAIRFNETEAKIEYCTGTDWAVIPETLSDLGNVDADNPNPGDLLGWDGTKWVPYLAVSCSPISENFHSISNVALNNLELSNVVQFLGPNCPTGATVGINSTGGDAQFRICGTFDCNTVIADWGDTNRSIADGQYIQIRLTSAPESLTTYTATVLIGNMSRNWSVTTEDAGTFKRVFVTSTTYSGSMGGLDGADARCQTRAQAAGLGGTSKAWLAASAGETPVTRFTHASVPYRRVDGTQVAANWTDLVDGTLSAPINKTEFNTTYSGQVYTNTESSGAFRSTTVACNGFQTDGGTATTGRAESQSSGWARYDQSGTIACTTLRPLYCFQQ